MKNSKNIIKNIAFNQAISSFNNLKEYDEQINPNQKYGLNIGLYLAKFTGWSCYKNNNYLSFRFAFQILESNGFGNYVTYTVMRKNNFLNIHTKFCNVIESLLLRRPKIEEEIELNSLIDKTCTLLIDLRSNINFVSTISIPYRSY